MRGVLKLLDGTPDACHPPYLGHEAPLQPAGEPSTAAAAQPRLLHLIDDPVRALEHEILGSVPIPSLLGALMQNPTRQARSTALRVDRNSTVMNGSNRP